MRFTRQLLLAATLLVGLLFSAPARAQAVWRLASTGLPGVNAVHSIACNNDRFVITFSRNGSAEYSTAWSTNGSTWQATPNFKFFRFQGSVITVGGVFYLAAGDGIWRSPDGEAWQRVFTLPRQDVSFYQLATDGLGLLVTLNSTEAGAVLYHSPDTLTWRETAVLPRASEGIYQTTIAYAQGRYYIRYNTNAGFSSYLYSTTDGTQWTPITTVANPAELAAGNGRLVVLDSAPGPLMRASTDGGTTWTESSQPPISGNRLRFAGGRFFMLGSLVSSPEGLSWSLQPALRLPESSRLLSVAQGKGETIAVGFQGFDEDGRAREELLVVSSSSASPSITQDPADSSALPGGRVILRVHYRDPDSTVSLQWYHNGSPILGATGPSLDITALKASDLGQYHVIVRTPHGSVTSRIATVTFGTPPVFGSIPSEITVEAGENVSIPATVDSIGQLSFQWLRDDEMVHGATQLRLELASILPSQAGLYTLRVTTPLGTFTSPPCRIKVTPVTRISNLSVLSPLTTPDDNIVLGYVVTRGASGKPVLLRAAGPALRQLGVASALDDPKVEAYTRDGAASPKLGENNDWGSSPAEAQAFAAVGAFPFQSLSRDAAMFTTVPSGDNSLRISSADRGTGLVLAEVYDRHPSDAFTNTTPRLQNISVLKEIGGGLTIGFTLAGGPTKTMLLRGIGPSLRALGVPGAAADTKLTLFNASGRVIASNDDWDTDIRNILPGIFQGVGAFALTSPKDAALTAELPPGNYSVRVEGVGGATGLALVEVYETALPGTPFIIGNGP